MKRTKFLALALVVAVMMMGAGYAYWAEELTISNKVVTGELDVIFTEPHVATEDTYMGQEPNDGSYCNVAGDESHGLDILLNKVYPGAKSTVTFALENSGTLGAYVDDFRFMNSETDRTERDASNEENLILCNKITIGDDAPIELNGTLAQALAFLNTEKGIYLEDEGTDGYKKEVTMELQIDPDANDDETSALYLDENHTFKFYIGADVYQYNDRL